ncbi:MAG: hypothetical protein J4432_01790, partial [DPANN group archaeon]|nr:hypothetical protein [DPANN group archaeon]
MAAAKELLDWIRKNLDQGKDPDVIIQELKDTGYTTEQVIEAFEQVTQEEGVEEPAAAPEEAPEIGFAEEIIAAEPLPQMPQAQAGGMMPSPMSFEPQPFGGEETTAGEGASTMTYLIIAAAVIIIGAALWFFFLQPKPAEVGPIIEE